MPIPTRSFSVREGQSGRKQTIGTPGKTATATPTSSTTSSTSSTISSTGPSTTRKIPLPNKTVDESDEKERRKSLLPQRSLSVSVRDEKMSGAGSPSRLPGRSITQRKQQQQQTDNEGTSTAMSNMARRTSLLRPSPLKPSPLKPSPLKATSPVKAPASPRKTELKKPTSPKKTDMPPPPVPRHGRSISLKQPPVSSPNPSPSHVGATARGHLRQRSQVVTPASPGKEVPPSPTTTTTPRRTLQSPRKVVKPPTPTGESSTKDLFSSSLPEVAALQTELLQLTLLHSSAAERFAKWRASEHEQLQRKYDSVATSYQDVVAKEKESQWRLNGQALALWVENCQEHNGRGFVDQIPVLSQVAQEVSELSDSAGGRYILAVREFEDWLQKAEKIRKWRSRIGQAAEQVVFIDPLEGAWKEELRAVMMKLEQCARQLQSLDILEYGNMERLGESALVRTAKGLNELIHTMIEEVNRICRIEGEVVESERKWVSHLTEQLTPRETGERGVRVGLWAKTLAS